MKSFLLILALLPVISFCQQQNTDTAQNDFKDSISASMLSCKYSVAHQLMVSFTKGSAYELNNFWTYLFSELRYKTDVPGKINLKPAKLGLFVSFLKYGKLFEPTAQSITVNLICNRNGDNLQSAFVTGDNDLLKELFVNYFGGTISSSTLLHGFYAAYTTTDEVRLLSNQIIILPKHPLTGLE